MFQIKRSLSILALNIYAVFCLLPPHLQSAGLTNDQVESNLINMLRSNKLNDSPDGKVPFESAVIAFHREGETRVIEYPENLGGEYELASLSKVFLQKAVFSKHYKRSFRDKKVVLDMNLTRDSGIAHTVTYEQLLSHYSGIGEKQNGSMFFYEPGIYFDYSNLNYSFFSQNYEKRFGGNIQSDMNEYLSGLGFDQQAALDLKKLKSGDGGMTVNKEQALILFQDLTKNINKSVNFLYWYDVAETEDRFKYTYYPAQGVKGYGEIFLDQENKEGYMLLVNYESDPVINYSEKLGLKSNSLQIGLFQNARSWTFDPNSNYPDIMGSYSELGNSEKSIKITQNPQNFCFFQPHLDKYDLLRTNDHYTFYYVERFEDSPTWQDHEAYLADNKDKVLQFQETENGLAFLYEEKLYVKNSKKVEEKLD